MSVTRGSAHRSPRVLRAGDPPTPRPPVPGPACPDPGPADRRPADPAPDRRGRRALPRTLAGAVAALLLLPVTASPAHAAPPPNDTADTATVITRLPTTIRQDTSEARDEPIDGEVILCPGGVPPAVRGSVWYAVTATDDDGFAVAARPGTDHSAAFIVTAGRPDPARDPVACGVGAVVVPTVAGTTYYVMAFSDVPDVVGGDLVVTFLRVPPTPTVAVTVDRRGHLRRDGTVRMRGTYACTGADTVEISGTVQQGPVAAPVRSHVVDLVLTSPVCDGEPHRWRAPATREPGMLALRRGVARSHVGAIACSLIECVVVENPVRVRLRGPGGR